MAQPAPDSGGRSSGLPTPNSCTTRGGTTPLKAGPDLRPSRLNPRCTNPGRHNIRHYGIALVRGFRAPSLPAQVGQRRSPLFEHSPGTSPRSEACDASNELSVILRRRRLISGNPNRFRWLATASARRISRSDRCSLLCRPACCKRYSGRQMVLLQARARGKTLMIIRTPSTVKYASDQQDAPFPVHSGRSICDALTSAIPQYGRLYRYAISAIDPVFWR